MDNYLLWLSKHTKTKWWHDSAIPYEIEAAIQNGAVGATTNPVLVYKALQAVPEFWKSEIDALPQNISDVEYVEALLKIVTSYAAKELYSIYEETNHENGYALAQVNPEYAGSTRLMLEQAKRYLKWGQNIAVKVPTTYAALAVIEKIAAEGAAVCTTLNFSVAQAVAAAEAYERGAEEARKNGIPVKPCFVVQQGGRLDDYLVDCAADEGLDLTEELIRNAGNSVTKRTYDIFKMRGYTAKIMPAGLRGVHNLTRFAGGDLVFSLQSRVQNMVIEAEPARKERIDEPNDEIVIDQLMKISEFKRAYLPDGLNEKEFLTFGLTQKTLSQFFWTGWSPLENYGSRRVTRWF